FHAASSSAQAKSKFAPRRRSASSELNMSAKAPFGHDTRRLDGSNSGLHQGEAVARIPLSPSTIVSLQSAAVGATNAMRPARPASTSSLTNSAPVLVLP